MRRRKERTVKRKEVRRKRMKKEGKVDVNIKERQQRKK